MEHPQAIPEFNLSIDAKTLKPLFSIQSYRHTIDMIVNWVIIFAVMYLCREYFHFHPLFYIFSVITIGARMHALAILMHDASHFRYLKNRKWNDVITNLFTMYPLFTSIEKYRQNHMRHHRHLNTEDDPDWVAKLGKREFRFPKTKREFLTTVFSYLVLYQGINDAIWFLRRFSSSGEKQNGEREKSTLRIVFFLVLFTVLTLFGLWKYYLLLWIIPYLSTFFMFQYIRSVAEHFGELAYDHELTHTRTVKATWLEKFFIAPHNVGYHLEHHLYPGVPYYNLPKLHRALMQDDNYNQKAHLTQGYVRGLLNELGAVTAQSDTAYP